MGSNPITDTIYCVVVKLVYTAVGSVMVFATNWPKLARPFNVVILCRFESCPRNHFEPWRNRHFCGKTRNPYLGNAGTRLVIVDAITKSRNGQWFESIYNKTAEMRLGEVARGYKVRVGNNLFYVGCKSQPVQIFFGGVYAT